jgi:hypothetical protein
MVELRGSAMPQAGMMTEATTVSKGCQFRMAMRKLWEDHVIWTRSVIVSAAGDLPGLQPDVDRLMRNQVDIGNAIKPYYGNEAGEGLIKLLKEHISGAYEVVLAAKASDTVRLGKANKAWYSNADEISVYLSKANPRYWPEKMMKAHMKEHLDITEAAAVVRLEKRWADDAAAYDKVHDQILKMADMLSDGIIKQFPEKF